MLMKITDSDYLFKKLQNEDIRKQYMKILNSFNAYHRSSPYLEAVKNIEKNKVEFEKLSDTRKKY